MRSRTKRKGIVGSKSRGTPGDQQTSEEAVGQLQQRIEAANTPKADVAIQEWESNSENPVI